MIIKQDEIWEISFDPSVGQEIQKSRPAVVLSNSFYNLASGTIFVVPLTSKKPKPENDPFFVVAEKTKKSGLAKTSFGNVSQIRSVSKLRFIKKLGMCDTAFREKSAEKWLDILEIGLSDRLSME